MIVMSLVNYSQVFREVRDQNYSPSQSGIVSIFRNIRSQPDRATLAVISRDGLSLINQFYGDLKHFEWLLILKTKIIYRKYLNFNYLLVLVTPTSRQDLRSENIFKDFQDPILLEFSPSVQDINIKYKPNSVTL